MEEEHEEEDDHCAPEYRNLIAIHAGKGKGGLDDWLKVDPDKVRRLSLSEQQLENAAKTHGPQIVRYWLNLYERVNALSSHSTLKKCSYESLY